MTKKEILEQQVDALEKLLQLKQAIIEELDAKVTRLEQERVYAPSVGYTPFPSRNPHISQFSNVCPNNQNGQGHHVYPSIWNGTVPPPCSLCGQAQNGNLTWITTFTNKSIPVKDNLIAFNNTAKK